MNREVRIDFGKIFNSLLKKWWIIVCSISIFLAISSIYSEINVKKQYESVTTVFSMSYASLSDSLSGSSALSAYADLVESRKVAESALSYLSGEIEYSPEEIQKMVSTNTTASNNSKLSEKIHITAQAPKPEEAIAIANAVANAFVIEMQNLTGANTVQILDSAETAHIANKNAKLQIKLIGAFWGGLLPILIIIFKEILSDEIYRIEDAGCNGKLEILAVIPDFDNM